MLSFWTNYDSAATEFVHAYDRMINDEAGAAFLAVHFAAGHGCTCALLQYS